MRIASRLAALLLSTTLSALVACGGHNFGAGNPEVLSAEWPGHGWESGARSGAFIAVAVDSTERKVDPLTSRLRLETVSDGSGTLATVFASGIEGGSVYLHLKYDEQSMHPVEAQRGATLDEDVLFLGVTTQPGVAVLGLTSIGGEPLPAGEVELAQVRFAPGAFVSDGLVRGASAVSQSAPDDLRFTGSNLQWGYNGAGDYDQNSETNIADLTPVGVHLGHSTTDGVHDPDDVVVDGDGNGIITIAELTPIGANFLRRTTGYQVQSGPSSTGPFSALPGGDVTQTSGVKPPGGGYLQYDFAVVAPQLGDYFVVQVFDGATAGPRSNVVQYTGSLAPPQNLTAGDDGTKITLDWDPPASGSPLGFDAFVSDSSDMSGALKMNGAIITGTTFDCNPIAVPVGAPHYFAVTAIYDSGSSGYSNIFGYMTGVGAPTGLAAAKEGGQVRLNWNPFTGAESYNAYVSANSDMSGALIMNLPGQVTTPTFLCPISVSADSEHYFAVKAVVDGSETAYSNIAHYVPGGGSDTTPPQWQGGTGIKLAEPDDQQIKVFWYPAIDPAPGTDPVQYFIYWEEEGTPIDWNSPQDVVIGATSHTITNLTNGQTYEVGVRAADSVAPTPNVTSNTNTLFSTPIPYPDEGQIGSIIASDIASVRMPGEEIPRVFAVTHGAELWYAIYDGTNWQTTDLNVVIGNPARKYHPQAVAIGDEIHVLFATSAEVFEFFGEKDADPSTWTIKSVTGGLSGVYGTGFVHNAADGYLAAVYACTFGPTEQLFYHDRDVSGEWSSGELVMNGDPSIWQCDLAVSEVTGAQWIAACNGPQVDDGTNSPLFWYATRTGRTGSWTAEVAQIDRGSGPEDVRSSTEITIEIDPSLNQPVVVNPETDWDIINLIYRVPSTSAAIYTWNGSSWVDEPSSPIDEGSSNNDDGTWVFTTNDRGRDPQLVFSAVGKAVAIWTNVKVVADYSSFDPEDVPTTVTGYWALSQRPEFAWSKPATNIRDGIYSSNSVTAGESYQHCLTCFVAISDFGDFQDDIIPKYGTHNHYPEGELYYFRQAWP